MSILKAFLNELERSKDPRTYVYGYDHGLRPSLIQRRENPLSILGYGGEHLSSSLDLNKQNQAVSHIGKDGFQVCVDVSQFKPNELNVKVVDNYVMIEGKHEERQDNHGYISRHFSRRYMLPKGYEADKVNSTLSSDGVLTIHAPKPNQNKSDERIVQIQQVGPAHLNVKQNNEEMSVDVATTNGNSSEKK